MTKTYVLPFFPNFSTFDDSETTLLFVGAGLIYMFLKAPPKWIRKPSVANSILLFGVGFWNSTSDNLIKIAWFFTKAGAFVFGSGLAIVPFCIAALLPNMDGLQNKSLLMLLQWL